MATAEEVRASRAAANAGSFSKLGAWAGGVGLVGGGLLGYLGARERQRNWRYMRDMIGKYEGEMINETRAFENAGRARIAAQSADIISQTGRRGNAVAASLARSANGTMGQRLTAGVRRSGAVSKARYEMEAFPALGEVVARQRQDIRRQVLEALGNLGAEPSTAFGAVEGLASVMPGIADLYQNINAVR